MLGRKGLGKFAGFGAAHVVEVWTVKDGRLTGFEMDYEHIVRGGAAQFVEPYKPNVLADRRVRKTDSIQRGTLVVLKRLQIRKAINAAQFRTSMTRRFAILSDTFRVHLTGDSLRREELPFQVRFPEKGKASVRSMANESLSPSRIRQAHQCLAAILEQAVDDGLIGRNPARRVELPRMDRPEHRFLTAEQVARLAEAMPNHQHKTVVYVLAYGGLRWGEMAALRRGRIDMLRRRLQISEALAEISGRFVFGPTKTYRTRTVHLPSFVADMLGRHLEDVADDPEALAFTAPRGGPLRHTDTRQRVWNPGRDEAGSDLADVTPHDLRHTCASLMRAAGADVKAIQQQLGHRNASVTMDTYTHLFEGDLDEVMDRLDAHFATESRPERVLGDVVDLIHRGKTPG